MNLSASLEDEWFVILKLTEIYRARSALFFDGNQLLFWV